VWKRCTSCGGTGKIDAAPCIYCRGIGWSLAKPWCF
jgi:DnaJ-class molecular chaperone